MSVKTKIQWCDSTVNPTMGCDGCEIWGTQRKTCYAGTLHQRFGGVTPGYAPKFEDVTLFSGRMEAAASWPSLVGKTRSGKPWLDGYPRIIFVSDMSDALSAAVPFEFLRDEVIRNVQGEQGSRHQWLWLTKRPDRMAKLSRWLGDQDIAWPGNLWAGTSVTSQATASRITHLLEAGGGRTIHFLSVEPQVEPIDLQPWLPKINWVIHGGESGRKARPFDLSWATSLIDHCRALKVPYFLKQLGSHPVEAGEKLILADGHGGDPAEWPDRVNVRQMPAIPQQVEPSMVTLPG